MWRPTRRGCGAYYEPLGQLQHITESLDTLGNHTHPILAQPPEELLGLKLGRPATVAAGITAMFKSGSFSFSQNGPVRGTHALLKPSQKDDFDWSSSAWPADDRSAAEFCENGAKATDSDAQVDPVGPVLLSMASQMDLGFTTRWLGISTGAHLGTVRNT